MTLPQHQKITTPGACYSPATTTRNQSNMQPSLTGPQRRSALWPILLRRLTALTGGCSRGRGRCGGRRGRWRRHQSRCGRGCTTGTRVLCAPQDRATQHFGVREGASLAPLALGRGLFGGGGGRRHCWRGCRERGIAGPAVAVACDLELGKVVNEGGALGCFGALERSGRAQRPLGRSAPARWMDSSKLKFLGCARARAFAWFLARRRALGEQRSVTYAA